MSNSFLGKFGQVGFVVGDAERVAGAFAEKFGIGPWNIKYLKASPGDPVPSSVIARCWVGETDFELIQCNIPAPQMHTKYHDQHGDSLHHLCFYPADYDLCFNKLMEMGYPLLAKGGFPGGVRYAYFDTTHDLGCIVEIAFFPESLINPNPPDRVIEAKGESILTKFTQVGFVVGDSERIATAYAKKFGIGPWRVKYLKARPDDKNPVTVVSRCFVGDTDFELIQCNIPAPQMHTQYHDKYGDSLHHLCFYPADYDLCFNKLTEEGYPLLNKGEWPGGVRYAYFDTTCDLGFIVEIAYFPEGMTDPNPAGRIIEAK